MIYNSQKMETTHLPTDEQLQKMWYVYTHEHNGVLFNPEKEGNSDICDNRAETWGHYIILSETSQIEKANTL